VVSGVVTLMKSTKKTVRQRVEEILSLRLLGANATDIRRHAEKKGWNVSDRQLQRYSAEADELLAASVERDRDRLMAYHFAARRALYARAMAAGDLSTARLVLRDEAELEGLYPPKKIAPTNPDGSKEYGTLTDAERVAALRALYATVGAGAGGTLADGTAGTSGSILGGPGAHPDGDGDDPGFLADGPPALGL
jgi:hypothetical protein